MFVGHCHQGMAHPRVANGGTDSEIEGGANKLNKQSRTAVKWWLSNFGVGRGANKTSL